MSRQQIYPETGSPPHTRDKFTSSVRFALVSRITPAYAGQIVRRGVPRSLHQDHPRIRGTNPAPPTGSLFTMGSPPHTRDKFCCLVLVLFCQRITPAYAGQIIAVYQNRLIYWDHPRIRGTNKNSIWHSFEDSGSSPHTRDKRDNIFDTRIYSGIIPAYAGQITIPFIRLGKQWDHPRIRGTNIGVKLFLKTLVGSSPHTRDKLVYRLKNLLSNGIIPAYAGQILYGLRYESIMWDHPRIRGTNLIWS